MRFCGKFPEGSESVRGVGTVPRVVNGVLFALTGAIVLTNQWAQQKFDLIPTLFVACAFVAFVASLRVGMSTVDGNVIVKSYFRTYALRLSRTDKFRCVPYSGFWNRFAPSRGWTNCNAYMLEVSQSDGKALHLPATLGGARATIRLAGHLNSLAGGTDACSSARS